MFDQWLKIPAHYYLRITALVILAVGVSLSNVLMSIGAIWIISNWLIEAKFSEYKTRILQSPELLLILGFLVWTMVSAAWSDDFWFAFKDIRIKLPMLAIPLALGSGKPLEKNVLPFILFVFIGLVLYTSVYNYVAFNLGDESQDIRKMSRFISQIRFATLVNLAAFISIALVIEKKWRWYLAVPVFSWLTFYTYKAQVVNGYVLYAVLFVFTYFYFVVKAKNYYAKVGLFVIFLGVVSVGVISVNKMIDRYQGLDPIEYNELELYTTQGNPYFHDTTQKVTENGHYVWMYVCQYELEKEWNERSAISYDSLDMKGQPMFGTLMRYLTSKNSRKDSAGVWSLSDDEVKAIEGGCTGINMNSGFEARVHSFLYEWEMYQHGADPNGFSFLQRMEHLKAAKKLVQKFWLFGCGIGDLKSEFDSYYTETNSLLLPENRLRAHNQFLTAWIATGVIGLICTMLFFIMPLIQMRWNYFSIICLISIFISFLSEDMLETQAGATIFALFYSLGVFNEREQAR